MNILNTRDENMAFEAWAQLLISRKVPENYRHFIDPEVVGEGAAILKRGEAFEVLVGKRIIVAPIPVSVLPPRVHW